MSIVGAADDILKLIMRGVEPAAETTTKGAKAAGKAAKTAKPKPRLKAGEYVRDRQRTAYPDIYGRPDEIARRAAERAAPEDPAMLDLFGVTRNDLYEMSKTPRVNPSIVRLPEKARGSEAAENVITDRNRQRLTDTMGEALKYPELSEGMLAWYNLDPAYQRLQQISNDAPRDFQRMNTFSGMASAGSDVMTELQRGSLARYLDEQGRFEDFAKYGTQPNQAGAPEDMRGVVGHPYSSTAHAIPMRHYSETGEIGIKAPKVPPYIQSSTPQELGGTWTVPVGDAHFSRAVGLADTRKGQEYGKSVSTPELTTLMPWWSRIARDVGVQEVPAQALTWGVFSPATGVETAVGAPKLELIAKAIMRRANELGVDPKVVRDAFLTGRMRLSVAGAGAGAGAGLLDAASPDDAAAAEIEQYLGGN